MTMVPDLELLLAPVSEDDRAGPDLAYDPQRHQIEQAFEASVSIDMTGTATQDPDIDWRRIVAEIVDQSARTKDVWLAVYLCRAGARAGRLETVELGLQYLEGLLEQFWDVVHPRLDEYGIEGRTGACATLTSFREFIAPLRALTLLDHARHGSFTGDDLHRFQRVGEAEAGYGAFRATLEEPESIERLARAAARLDAIQMLLRNVDATLAARAGNGAGASFAPIYEALAEIGGAARAFLPVTAVEAALAEEEGAPAPAERRLPGTIQSREDVARMIDLVTDYYRRSEPHSPVPLLLARAKEWINLDFMEVLEDIAPNAVGDARQLLNFRRGAQ